MADPARLRETAADTKLRAPPPPAWVKRFGLVAAVLVILFALLHLTGRGFGHHMHSGDARGVTGGGP
jgi:hypothetical protein